MPSGIIMVLSFEQITAGRRGRRLLSPGLKKGWLIVSFVTNYLFQSYLARPHGDPQLLSLHFASPAHEGLKVKNSVKVSFFSR